MNLDDINELIGVATSEAAVIEAVSRAVRRLEAVQAAQVQLQTLPSDVLRQAFAGAHPAPQDGHVIVTATVAELKRAWRAVESGVFRDPASHPAQPEGVRPGQWTPQPGEQVLPVVGAHGLSGASILSLAWRRRPRRHGSWSAPCLGRCGLVAAPTAELGDYDGFWTRGLRDDVLVERVAGDLRDCGEVPRTVGGRQDLGADGAGRRLGRRGSCWRPSGWLAAALTTSSRRWWSPATATVAGLRRLETTLAVLDRPDACRVVLLGPARRRWPKGLAVTFGPLTRALDRRGCVFTVPIVASLRVGGVDSRPLPAELCWPLQSRCWVRPRRPIPLSMLERKTDDSGSVADLPGRPAGGAAVRRSADRLRLVGRAGVVRGRRGGRVGCGGRGPDLRHAARQQGRCDRRGRGVHRRDRLHGAAVDGGRITGRGASDETATSHPRPAPVAQPWGQGRLLCAVRLVLATTVVCLLAGLAVHGPRRLSPHSRLTPEPPFTPQIHRPTR